MSKIKKKGFLYTVSAIQSLVKERNLQSGDKIPSERELSDVLEIGRSSVREGLRALEIIGIIETRVGEGTFLNDPKEFQVVEILGSFFLAHNNTAKDLIDTRYLFESQVVLSDELLTEWMQMISNLEIAQTSTAHDYHQLLFERLIGLQTNRIIRRIWFVVQSYITHLPLEHPEEGIELYKALVLHAKENDEQKLKQQLVALKNYYELNIRQFESDWVL